MTSDKYEERQKRMYLQHQRIMESDFAEVPRKADEGLSMPGGQADVLDYLGNIEPLNFTEEEKNAVRNLLKPLIKRKGLKYVWQNSTLIRFEMDYARETFGL